MFLYASIEKREIKKIGIGRAIVISLNHRLNKRTVNRRI